MTPEQRNVIFGLVLVPGRGRRSSSEDVLRCFGTSDGAGLGLSLLRQAVADRDSADVEAALLVCQRFGFGPYHLPLLLVLASGDWHYKHEDVIWYLGQNYQTPDVVEALIHATEWVPGYLDFDDSRALARKAVWELGKQPGARAREALEKVAEWATGALADDVRHQLQK